MRQEQKKIDSLGALRALAGECAERWERAAAGRSAATVVGLSGELGAGKTAFVQTLAAALGVRDAVQSPTFVIQKVYALEGRALEQLVHIDAYRLEGAAALERLGFGELRADAKNLILVEWPERVREALPEDMETLCFEALEGEARSVILEQAYG